MGNHVFDRVLALSPHADDVELGAGGTIAKMLELGTEVYHVVFSGGEQSVPEGYPKDMRRKECKASNEVLGIPIDNLILLDYEIRAFPMQRQQILETMRELNEKIRPELVLVPSSSDIHQDHNTIYMEALRVFKTTSTIWGYEQPWNNLVFTTNVFVILGERHLNRKVKALSKHLSQKFRPYMRKEHVISLARSRGGQIDVPYAESFELIRLLFSGT